MFVELGDLSLLPMSKLPFGSKIVFSGSENPIIDICCDAPVGMLIWCHVVIIMPRHVLFAPFDIDVALSVIVIVACSKNGG